MLIIRSREAAQELRRLTSDLQRVMGELSTYAAKSSRPRARDHPDRRSNRSQKRADQTLLPLHLSFCRTTLKKDASGIEASGSVFFARRMVTIDPRSTWIGLRPSSVR